jgi:hypothetical protein
LARLLSETRLTTLHAIAWSRPARRPPRQCSACRTSCMHSHSAATQQLLLRTARTVSTRGKAPQRVRAGALYAPHRAARGRQHREHGRTLERLPGILIDGGAVSTHILQDVKELALQQDKSWLSVAAAALRCCHASRCCMRCHSVPHRCCRWSWDAASRWHTLLVVVLLLLTMLRRPSSRAIDIAGTTRVLS